MYDIPVAPQDAYSKFKESDCSPGAPVLDVTMGMGGRIDGLMVCSSCRKPPVVHLFKKEWVHAAWRG